MGGSDRCTWCDCGPYDGAARDDVRSDAHLFRDVARRPYSAKFHAPASGLAHPDLLADILRNSHCRGRRVLSDLDLGFGNEHRNARGVRAGFSCGSDAAQTAPRAEGNVSDSIRAISDTRNVSRAGAISDLLLESRQPAGVGILPVSLARIFDL